jgi:hypothetical protein
MWCHSSILLGPNAEPQGSNLSRNVVHICSHRPATDRLRRLIQIRCGLVFIRLTFAIRSKNW